MPAHRILQFNAAATAACAVAMLALRGLLHPWFGLGSPLILDAVAIGFLAYAGVLAHAARRRPVDRGALLAFAAADALWVAVSAVVLVAFWSELTLVARALILAVALFCEVVATLQFRAAGRARAGTPQPA
jgi:hypothetical protein